jgi:hypothetical protein
MIDVASVDQLADECALLGCSGKRRQQREKLLTVLRPSVVLERSAQRQVLRLGLFGDLVNVGGDEGEWILEIALVLGEMEADAADDVPDRAVRLQITLDAVVVSLGLGLESRTRVRPDVCKQLGCQQLGALHRRRGLAHVPQLVPIRIGDDE